jgi:hypothetical protein
LGIKDKATGKKERTDDNHSSLAERLVDRRWPTPPQGMLLGDYEVSPYVREGRVFTRALRLHQQVSEPIPPGETAITSLCRGQNGKIYGATSGHRSHLLYYDPAPTGDGVVDLGVLPGVTAVRRALVSLGEFIYAGASESEESAEPGRLFRHEIAADHTDEFRAYKGKTEPVVIPVKGEGIAALCADQERGVLYGVSAGTGTFFRYDFKSDKCKSYGPVSRDTAFSRTLVVDGSGNVFGTHSLGTLYRFSPETEKVEDLKIKIPTVAGRDFYNQLDAAVYDPYSGLIYGAGTADGVLFSLDPPNLSIRTIGKVIAEPRVRAIAAAPDGRIFGISGNEDGMGHLFCYDRRELRDLGIMFGVSEIWRRGFEFDAACTGENGEIYFGESEWESNLFIYFPRLERQYQVPF